MTKSIFDYGDKAPGQNHQVVIAAIAVGKHLDPFRTQQLSRLTWYAVLRYASPREPYLAAITFLSFSLLTLKLNIIPHMFGSPVTELVENRDQGLSCFRERILHFRRDLRVNLSGNETIFLEFAELFCQHPLGDPGLEPC